MEHLFVSCNVFFPKMRLVPFITTAIIIGAIIFFFAWVFGRSWSVQTSENQRLFIQGVVPAPIPEGFYQGTIEDYQSAWAGSRFYSGTSTGIHVFKENKREKAQYPFKTYIGKGLQDQNIDVLKIDHNREGNPFWIRMIVGEIVQVNEQTYLGKIHVQIIPNIPFTLTYFHLQRL